MQIILFVLLLASYGAPTLATNSTANATNGSNLTLNALMEKMESLERQMEDLKQKQLEMKSLEREVKELKQKQLKRKVILDDDSSRYHFRVWWKHDPTVSISGNTITIQGHGSIRSMFSLSTSSMRPKPDNTINHFINYCEFTIDQAGLNFYEAKEMEMERYDELTIGLAPIKFPTPDSSRFLFAINDIGNLWRFDSGRDIGNRFGSKHLSRNDNDDDSSHFGPYIKQNDTIGVGVMLVQHGFESLTRWMFFTKNGKICDTPMPLLPNFSEELYPAISVRGTSLWKLTVNFGRGTEPFKYKIPPAEGLVQEPFSFVSQIGPEY